MDINNINKKLYYLSLSSHIKHTETDFIRLRIRTPNFASTYILYKNKKLILFLRQCKLGLNMCWQKIIVSASIKWS